MPAKTKVYPDWVQQYRERGTTIKKKGDSYYLYKRTSKRVPGKKYPQPVDTYIGVITPEGVVRTQKKKVTLTDIEVLEYGFSKALMELCPQGWKDAVGDEWEDLLRLIIYRQSGRTYLQKGYVMREPGSFHCSFSAQAGMLSRRIYKEHKVDMKDLEPLKDIFLVYIGKEEAVSRIGDEQRQLLDRIGVELGA